jgi:hypothetical protein
MFSLRNKKEQPPRSDNPGAKKVTKKKPVVQKFIHDENSANTDNEPLNFWQNEPMETKSPESKTQNPDPPKHTNPTPQQKPEPLINNIPQTVLKGNVKKAKPKIKQGSQNGLIKDYVSIENNLKKLNSGESIGSPG